MAVVNTDLQKKITHLLAFYDKTTGLVDDRRADRVVYLDSSKAFENLSYHPETVEVGLRLMASD